jgi:ABC-type nitrate/sulfonate/bicarbonate transport system substrate-binding protein
MVTAIPALAMLMACSPDDGDDTSQAEAPKQDRTLASAGDTIPEVTLKAGFSPYGDELLAVAGIKRGYFDDVGIHINPEPNGAKTDLIASLTPLLNDQIELGSGYLPAVAPQLDNVQNVKTFAVSDVFYGYRLLAPKGKYKTVAELMDGGASYKEAVTQVLDQVKDQKVILRQGVPPTFYELITQTAGGSMQDWNVTYLSNPDIVRAAQSGQADFVSPTGAVELVRLLQDGWESLVALPEVIENMPADKTISLRSTFSGYLTTQEYADENWDTLLRFTSVMYRLIDDMQADTEAVAADYVDYLNAYTGSSLTATELAKTFDGLYSLRNFDEATEFYDDSSAPFNLAEVAGAQLAELAGNGVIEDGHSIDQLSIAGEIYHALVEYRKAADDALAKAPDGELKQRAQAQYDARNYLDAYRLAAAAGEQS